MSLQITPAFVKEAFALLSQSIIHVEKDAVELDDDDEEDDENDEAANRRRRATTGLDGDEEIEHADQPPTSSAAIPTSSPTNRRPPAAGSRDPTPAPSATPAPAPKKKIAISYDKYMTIMQKVVYMLADVERETSKGLPRSEVVTRYLESMEDSLSDIDELNSETLLIEKVLTKLVKVRFFFYAMCYQSALTKKITFQEKYLIELRGEIQDLEEGEQDSEDNHDPIMSVHPDCDVITS